MPRQRPRTEQDPRDSRIEEQEREIARLREELTRVESDRDQWKRDRDRWKRRSEHLKQQLDAARRAGFRQAAPFAKDRPQGRGGRPGRRAGARYGRQACRPRPPQVDETCRAPVAAACPDCGGAVELSRVATQYQEDLPVVRPIVRRFDIEVGHCSQCRRRVQGRHRLQTSDALGAASVQLGPEVVALVVRMHTHLGVPLAKVAHRDGTTPHVHVVANRVSTEDGRAAPLSQSRLQLSRWAESYERKQGRIQCPRRVEHNRDRRLVGPQYDPTLTASMYDWHATGDAHYRRTQCGRIARVPIADGRTALAMAGVAVRRVDEQRKWQTVRARRDEARAPLDETQRREWAALYARQEDERDRLDWDARSLRGRVERWRTSRGFWSDLGGVIRGKAFVLDRWRHDLERDQREDRAALGHEHSAQALEVDRRAQRTNERAMKEPVMLRQQDLAAIAQELKSQGLQPGVEAGRALARIANGALAHMGITSERTHERDYDRDFGPSR